MEKEGQISEFEAAQLIKLSPTLLRWCTSYAPKGDSVKLNYKIIDGTYYFDKKELIEFNSHLNMPWSKKKDGKRPKNGGRCYLVT